MLSCGFVGFRVGVRVRVEGFAMDLVGCGPGCCESVLSHNVLVV